MTVLSLVPEEETEHPIQEALDELGKLVDDTDMVEGILIAVISDGGQVNIIPGNLDECAIVTLGNIIIHRQIMTLEGWEAD